MFVCEFVRMHDVNSCIFVFVCGFVCIHDINRFNKHTIIISLQGGKPVTPDGKPYTIYLIIFTNYIIILSTVKSA